MTTSASTSVPNRLVLPVSTYVTVGMWMALETFLIRLTSVETTGRDADMVVLPMLGAGILAAALMVSAWLVFSGAPATELKSDRVRFWLFYGLVASVAAFLLAGLLLTNHDSTPQVRDWGPGLSAIAAGCLVIWLLMRHYFRMRLTHLSEPPLLTNRRSEVSIQKLLVVTGVLACLLGISRSLSGQLDAALIQLSGFGCLVGLMWWATASWLLGRHRYFIFALAMFVIVQLCSFLTDVMAPSAAGDAWPVAAVFITSLQLHLLLFLSMMRASQFRLRTG